MLSKGVTITKENAGKITTKPECLEQMSAIRYALDKAESRMQRTEKELSYLHEIKDVVEKRYNFLERTDNERISVNVGEWFKSTTGPMIVKVTKISDDNRTMSADEYTFDGRPFVGSRYDSSFDMIVEPISDKKTILPKAKRDEETKIGDKSCRIRSRSYNLIGSMGNTSSFADNWLPIDKLSLMVQCPEILQVDSLYQQLLEMKSCHVEQVERNGLPSFVHHDGSWCVYYSVSR